MYRPNQKLVVRANHPSHPDRTGYFEFLGGPDQDVVVLRVESDASANPKTFFAVGLDDVLMEDYDGVG
jgi:hypothetical protein